MSHDLTEAAREDDVHRVSPLRWLLILPFIGVLSVPFYNVVEPTFWAVPFFYWYQLLWVLLCGGIIGVVFAVESRPA